MGVWDKVALLSDEIKHSDEYKAFKQAEDYAFEDETSKALLKEFNRLQTQLQMVAVAGREMKEEDVSRFQKMSSLLYATPQTSAYLLAQMRMQKFMAEIFSQLSKEAGLPIEVPNNMT